jgi:hypothetical protein
MQQRALLISLLLAIRAIAASAEGPVAVSPGSLERPIRIDSRCPTFSWASQQQAIGHELVVFEIEGSPPEGEAGPAALWIELPAGATSWTPSAAECLERGKSYAWFVRAGADGPEAPRSEARLFEIGGSPTVAEVEEALDTLRRYLEAEADGADSAPIAEAISAFASRTGAASAPAPTPPAAPATPTETAAGTLEVGISSRPTSGSSGTVGVLGATESDIDQSVGVLGEALALTGISDGVRGTSTSTNGTGVRGTSSALTGVTAGVWGGASSPDGYGAFFFNLGLGIPGGPGLFSSGALNTSADLILGGNVFWDEVDKDDGRIHSDPLHLSSDIALQSNDDVNVYLDFDDEGEDADFSVRNASGQALFNVDHTGTTFVLGDLTILGEPQGGLVSLDDVAALIQDHRIADHPKLAFVTSLTYDGDLGGLSGADDKCMTRASSAGLTGSFKAWISGDSASEEARDRLTHADVPYRRTDTIKIADDWDDLIDGSLDAPLNVDEHGNTVVSSLTAYTNTDSNGTMHEIGRECGPGAGPQWDSDSALESGGYGAVGSTGTAWSWTNNDACSNFRRLYCFEQ